MLEFYNDVWSWDKNPLSEVFLSIALLTRFFGISSNYINRYTMRYYFYLFFVMVLGQKIPKTKYF